MIQASSPTAADIEDMALSALAAIPEPLRRHLHGVAVQVVDFADSETLSEVGLADPWELLGLYHGISLDQKSTMDLPTGPDIIVLYHRPIVEFWRSGHDSLDHVVRHILIHEAGHHFGFSDADMAAIERLAE